MARETGVRIALENVFSMQMENGKYVRFPSGCYVIKDGFVGSAEEMLAYAEYGKDDGFGICLDTGHALMLGYNPAELIRAYGSHLIALHINDNPGKYYVDDFHMLPGSMLWAENADWQDISAALKEIDYQGTYNLEIIYSYEVSEGKAPFYALAAVVARSLANA